MLEINTFFLKGGGDRLQCDMHKKLRVAGIGYRDPPFQKKINLASIFVFLVYLVATLTKNITNSDLNEYYIRIYNFVLDTLCYTEIQ